MDEIEQLLEKAKRTLKQPEQGDADVLKELSAIPKLESRIGGGTAPEDKIAHKQDKQQARLKDIPTKTKPVKAETAGKDWFDLGKPEMTPALKRDLQLLRMRHVLDPKRFYKTEKAAPSKYFAVGTIKEDPSEFFSARLTKKERKKTLAEEILAGRPDYFKSRYKQIQKAKTSGRKKHYKRIKDMRA